MTTLYQMFVKNPPSITDVSIRDYPLITFVVLK